MVFTEKRKKSEEDRLLDALVPFGEGFRSFSFITLFAAYADVGDAVHSAAGKRNNMVHVAFSFGVE